MSRLLRLALNAALLWAAVDAVERANFKTCSQSGFCARLRSKEAGVVRYAVDPASVSIGNSRLYATLVDQRDNFRLGLEVSAVSDGAARFRIYETNPIKPRYEVPDVILPYESTAFKVVSQTSSATRLRHSGTKNEVEIIYNPFRINFYSGGELVISGNSNDLLNFEYLRNRPEEHMEMPQKNDQGQYVDPEAGIRYEQWQANKNGFDTEFFKNFPDSRPNGPSAVGMDWGFNGFEHVFGIPEHADTFALKYTDDSDPYRLYNLDVFEFELYNPMALYGSIPVMWAHKAAKTVAIFWLNASETWVDILKSLSKDGKQKGTNWISESGIIDTFIMYGPKPADVAKEYARLTGTTYLPPKWSIAYHQCRWNYISTEDVKEVDANFDVHDLPYDTIWLDIEHTNDKRYFTWHPVHFTEPQPMQENLKSKKRHMVVIIDPHIKRDHGYHIHSGANEKGFYVKKKEGGDYDGWCWPGSSSWLDFLRSDVREWYKEQFSLENYKGSSDILHVWNDMNEPSVFNGPEISMHKDAIHNGSWEHRDVHNLYGIYHQRATFEGLIQRSNGNERPFVLSRAFFAGSQRYGAIWTGDNAANWEHLRVSPQMLLTINLAGLPFSGVDVGGFFGNPSGQLMTRWYQAGVFYPFFRAHAHLDANRREPWLLSPEEMARVRVSLRARYALLPSLYTMFYESHLHGEPIMRSLWYEFPSDTSTFGMDDGYMLGDSILVNPVYEENARAKTVYFPGNEAWYHMYSSDVKKGPGPKTFPVDLDTVPAYQRAGTILSLQMRPRRNSVLMANDPYTLRIALDSQGNAKGKLFLDDDRSYNYQKGQFAFREFQLNKNVITAQAVDRSGTFEAENRVERIVLLGWTSEPSKVVAEEKGQKRDVAFLYNSSRKTLTLKNPGVNISGDWAITIA